MQCSLTGWGLAMLPKRGQDDIECETVPQYFDLSIGMIEFLKDFAARDGVSLRVFMRNLLALGIETAAAQREAKRNG
jgi:hypothetical protein